MFAVVDTGPLYAAVDESDADHEASLEALGTTGLHLVIPAMVVAETCYLVGTRMGAKVEARFLRSLGDLDVVAPDPLDWKRIGDLVERHGTFPLGGTDAAVIALAERLKTDLVITLDRRHFEAVRPRHVKTLRLLP